MARKTLIPNLRKYLKVAEAAGVNEGLLEQIENRKSIVRLVGRSYTEFSPELIAEIRKHGFEQIIVDPITGQDIFRYIILGK